MAGTSFAQRAVKDGVDRTSVEGAANLPYAIPNLAVELTTTESPVPVLWWRVVGSSHTAYAVEAFIDEVAEAAGQDPYRFRRALLAGQPRGERSRFPDGAVRNHNSAGLDHTRYSEARIGDYICAPHDDGLGHSLAHPCNQLARGREPGRASSARTDLFEVLRKKSPGTVRRSWPLREGPRPAFSAGKSRIPRSRSAGLFAYSPGIHYQDPLTPAWSFYPLAREGYLASSDSSFASSRPAANWCSGRRGYCDHVFGEQQAVILAGNLDGQWLACAFWPCT
jgi:hypothetical protein